MKTTGLIFALTTAATLAACSTMSGTDSAGATASGGSAMAMLKTAAGADVGRATVMQNGTALTVRVDGRAMPPGTHGVHVHTVGRCDAPDFATAGGHWNPSGTQHGTQNPQGPHAGDLPNLMVAADGTGTLTMTLPGGTIDGLFDTDGSAFVVHAAADDLKTDPSGNSGARIACGVFTRG